ncbi:MAG: tetratricopeptide repeat protein, partial [Candidatus Heimdallarchaeota archaeon]
TLAQKGEIEQALTKVTRCNKNLQQKIKKLRSNPEVVNELTKQLVKAIRLEGQLYLSKNVISKSINLYNKGLSLLENLPSETEVIYLKAHINYSLALIEFILDRLENAYERYSKGKSYFESIRYYEESVEIIFRMIDISTKLRDYEKAWVISKDLKSNIKKIKDKDKKRALVPKSYQVQSMILFNQNNSKEAIKLLGKAKKEFQKVNNLEGIISVLIDQSKNEPNISIEKQEDLLLEALELASMVESKKYLSIIETELGIISLKTGNFEKGKKRLLRGLKLKTEIGDKSGTAQSLIELSRITLVTSHNESEFSKAKNFAKQAFDLFSEIENDYGKAQALELMGTIDTKLGSYSKALQSLLSSRKLFKKFRDTNGEARALTQLGIVLDLKGESEETQIVLEKAEALYKKRNNRQGLAEVYQLLGNVTKNKKLALNYFKQSYTLYSEIIGDKASLRKILFLLDVKIKELSS